MSEPLYKRRWFKVGAIMLVMGLFTYFLADTTIAKYEARYPELAKDDNQKMLDGLAQPRGLEAPIKSDAEKEERVKTAHLHSLYGLYTYVGWVFIVLGFLFMALSLKEPQVPKLEDLDDLPPDTR